MTEKKKETRRRSSPLSIFRISEGKIRMNKGKAIFVEIMMNE